MLRTDRGLLKFCLLSIVTLGIYGIVVWSHISEEINQVATPRDGKHTMHYCLVCFVFSWLTFGIVPLVWGHRITERVGDELKARNLPYSISAGTYWGWNILGALIIVGPFVYIYKFLTTMNMINADYNAKGR